MRNVFGPYVQEREAEASLHLVRSARGNVSDADMYVLLRRWARNLAEEWGPPRPVWELALEERLGRKLTLAEIQPSIRRVI